MSRGDGQGIGSGRHARLKRRLEGLGRWVSRDCEGGRGPRLGRRPPWLCGWVGKMRGGYWGVVRVVV